MRKNILLTAFSLFSLALPAQAAPFDDYDTISATIFAYQRIGEDYEAASSLRTEQFAEQIQELVDGDYHIAALPDLITALQSDTPLPPNTVALTFDGGFKSVLTNAIPELERRGLPYTLFIPAELIGAGNEQYLSWQDLKTIMKSDLATVGIHPSAYAGLRDRSDTAIKRQINTAIGDFEKHLGFRPKFFAYPFGEYDEAYTPIVKEYEFTAAFGQQSGVTYNGSDFYALPRFLMTEGYGDLPRFRMAAQALPLPVSAVEPEASFITENPPAIGFTLHDDMMDELSALSCYASNQTEATIEKLGENRVELRLPEEFHETRGRINCTLPAGKNDEGETVWRWFGMLFVYDQPETLEEFPLIP